MADFRSRWASIRFVAATLILVFLTSPAAHSAALIRCPDWQRYVTPAAALRNTPPKQSFDAAMAANRARESRVASATPQRMPTRTLAGHPLPRQGFLESSREGQLATNRTTFPRTARTESAASQTAGPLDAAGIFSRDGRRDTNKVNKRRVKPQATPCPTHTVHKGDTLSKIAAVKLGNAKRYPELITANPGKIKSAKTLRVGTVLTLPCTVPTRQTASLQGKLKPRSGAAKTAPAPALVAVKPLPTTRPLRMTPVPVWTARPGEFVSDVIDRWAKRARHTVVRDGVEEWKISVPVKISGSFKHALDQLVVGFEGSGRPLAISLYANKVIRIGRPL